jgi:hypothetical protein
MFTRVTAKIGGKKKGTPNKQRVFHLFWDERQLG